MFSNGHIEIHAMIAKTIDYTFYGVKNKRADYLFWTSFIS